MKQTSRSPSVYLIVAVCALGSCDPDGGGDAGADSGRADTAPFDSARPDTAVVDSGPPPGFAVRLSHDIPGMVGAPPAAGGETVVGGAHVCTWLENGGVLLPVPPQWLTRSIGPLPFRGVSPYVPFPTIAPVDYLLGVYDAADLAGGCPVDPRAGEAPPAAVLDTISPDAVPTGTRSTIILNGWLAGTFGAAETERPSLCGPTLSGPCGQAAARTIVNDDPRMPPPSMARVRASNQIANVDPAPFNVCYDATLVPMAATPTVCMDVNPGDLAEALFAAVGFGVTTDYVERAPLVPTIPAMGVGGALYLVVETGATGCPPYEAGVHGGCLPIAAAFPEPPPAENIQPMLAEGHVSTLFINGSLGLSEPERATFRTRDVFLAGQPLSVRGSRARFALVRAAREATCLAALMLLSACGIGESGGPCAYDSDCLSFDEVCIDRVCTAAGSGDSSVRPDTSPADTGSADSSVDDSGEPIDSEMPADTGSDAADASLCPDPLGDYSVSAIPAPPCGTAALGNGAIIAVGSGSCAFTIASASLPAADGGFVLDMSGDLVMDMSSIGVGGDPPVNCTGTFAGAVLTLSCGTCAIELTRSGP